MKHAAIHTDGGARGNPGPAAIGYTIEILGEPTVLVGQTIGATTNNQAEYQAVVAALADAVRRGVTSVDVYADSELVVKQLRGEYKVKNKDLAPWFVKATSLLHAIGRFQLHTIPREANATADSLVNKALDDAI